LLDDIALQEPQCGCASAAAPMSGREHVVPDQGFSLNPWANQSWLTSALNGSVEARRDYDVAGVCWNQERWPIDLDSFGESPVGTPPRRIS
jgi:hypothetical protein